MKISILLGSTRSNGNSEQLSDLVVKNLDVKKVYLKGCLIKPIVDLRHSGGFQSVQDDFNCVLTKIMDSDVLIFATPIYWYSMSGVMKNFIDRLSQAIRDPNHPDFKEKLSKMKTIVLAVGGDEPRIKGLPFIQQFRYIFEFLDMPLTAYILAEGNRPGDLEKDSMALTQAAEINRLLVEMAE